MDGNRLNSVQEKRKEKEGACFALWKLPDENKVSVLSCGQTQELDSVNLRQLQGFVMAPFQGRPVFWKSEVRRSLALEKCKAFFAKKKKMLPLKKKTAHNLPHFSSLVEKSQEEMKKNKLEKIVLTRYLDCPIKDLDVWKFFFALCAKTPSFVSLVSSPQSGVWITASPEILVHAQDGIFRTVALAATQPARQEAKALTWTQKENEEHGPRSIHAGHLAHLCTDFKVDMKAINYPDFGTELLQLLHPTSAVCGMPKENALAFIHSFEGYNREYYTGFIGPVEGEESHLFVNIRCAQIFEDGLRLYAGAGITTDSIAEKEKEEVDLKIKNFMSFLP